MKNNLLNDKNRENRYCAAVFLYVFAALIIRFTCFGFKYYPQLDDYIQYSNYHNAGSHWGLILAQGLLSSRPLAGIFDLYVWGYFFNHMIWGVVLISAMYALSAVLFLRVFSKYFGTGVMFVTFYSLMPFFFEGAYWVSASSRVVVGLFFTAASVYFLSEFFSTKKILNAVLFWIFQLLASCLYEQILIIAFVLAFGLSILEFKNSKKSLLINLITLANAAIYIGITFAFKASDDSALAGRMKIVVPSFTPFYAEFLRNLSEQFVSAFVSVPAEITFKGFVRGIWIMLSQKKILSLFGCIAVGAGAYVLCVRKEDCEPPRVRNAGFTLFCALVAAAAPVSLFFIIDNTYFCLRNILASYVGIAIIFDMIFTRVFLGSRRAAGVAAFVMAFVFAASSVSEMHDYKAVNEFDRKIGNAVVQQIPLDEIRDGERAALLINSADKGTITAKYHEHVSGVISSDWAFQGFLTHLRQKRSPGGIVPIEYEDSVYHVRWNADALRLTGFDRIYAWNNERGMFEQLYISDYSGGGDDYYTLSDSSGNVAATVKETGDMGYLFMDTNSLSASENS